MLLRRYLIPDYLHNPVTLMTLVVAFAGSNQLQPESGLFTVTVMGIVLANQRWVSVLHIAEFKETLSVLLISSLFILLAARLEVSQLVRSEPGGRWHFCSLSFLWLARYRWRLRRSDLALSGASALLAAMCPAGIVAAAVSSVFALRLRAAHVAGAEKLVPLVFVVIVGTVVVYGLAAAPFGALAWCSARPNAQGCLIVGGEIRLARAIAKPLSGIRSLRVARRYEPQRTCASAGRRAAGLLRKYRGTARRESDRDERAGTAAGDDGQ